MPDGRDESYYWIILAILLCQTGDFKKLEQVLKLGKIDTKDNFVETCRSYIRTMNSMEYLTHSGCNMTYMSEFVSTITQFVQNLEKHPNLSDAHRCIMPTFHELMTKLQNSKSSLKNNGTDDLLSSLYSPLLSLYEQLRSSFAIPSSHPGFFQVQYSMFEDSQRSRKEALEHFETCRASSTGSLMYSDDHNSLHTNTMVSNALTLEYDDRSLQFLENLIKSTKPQPSILRQLAHYYKKHKDLPMAISYYRTIIDECNLPPNAIDIVGAYSGIGCAFIELQDFESALWNYRRARDLLLQHHPSTHPRLSPLENVVLKLERFMQLAQELSKVLNEN